MTKRLNCYVFMMLMGVLVWLEGSCRFISGWFMNLIILLPPLPVSVHYLIRYLFDLGVTYGEVLFMLLILSDWRSKRGDKWEGYKKALHLYLIIGAILEKIIIYIFVNLFSVFIESDPAVITMTMAVKIVTIFFTVIVVMRISLKNKNQSLYIDRCSLKHFAAGAIITIGFTGLCSLKEWQDYKIFMTGMDAYDFFGQMTALTPVYSVFNEWLVPYMVRICAVLLFMGEGRRDENLMRVLHSGDFINYVY